MRRKNWSRFPRLKKHRPFETDSHFESGKPEIEEWMPESGYKEKDYFKAYLAEVKNIPNCDSDALIKHWKTYKDKASFNRLIRAHLKIVVNIAYSIADEYAFKPSYNVIPDRKAAKKGYHCVVADLICAGNWGLLQAAKRFRLDAGASFATAADGQLRRRYASAVSTPCRTCP